MPRRQPREYLQRPDWFGRRPDAALTSKPGSLPERGNRGAARYQHLAACQVRRILDEQQTTTEEFAAQLCITADTLRRKLRGETVTTMPEIIAWTIALGIEVLPAPNSVDELES